VSTYDVVIIGGGHNGLTAAAYLARAGARTVVLERRPMVGGACVTEEPWPGYRINTYAYLAGMLDPRVARELELSRHGYVTLAHDPELFVPLPDRRCLTFWEDANRTLQEIARFSERDARSYPKYLEYWREVLELVWPLVTEPPRSLAELAGEFPGPTYERLLRDLLLRSARDLLDDWFESEALKAALGFSGSVGAFAGPGTPGTAYLLAHNSITELGGRRGAWGFAVGGMGRISEAIASAARHAGAEIRTGTGVAEIRIRQGRAVGVRTESGEVIDARAVASAVDVKQTLLGLVPDGALPVEVLREVRRFRTYPTTLKFNAALRELPDFRASPGAPARHHVASVQIGPSLEYLERAYDQAKAGRFPEHPFMEVLFQSAADPSVAPPGHHTMTCSVKFAPMRPNGGEWESFRDEAAEIVRNTLAEYAPNLPSLIEHEQVVTPADIEQNLGMTGGSCFHGDLTPDQMFALRPFPGVEPYRLPLDALYLCGSSAPPGGGVTGLPGRNAAERILRDLRSATPVKVPS
jgi:phytoene dehydrogenase-like protein